MKNNNFKEISKFEIYTVLHSRLKTHKRTIKLKNKNIYFQPALYWSLFKNYEKSYSNEILHHQIMNIYFYFENDTQNEKTIFQKIDKFLVNTNSQELKIIMNELEYFVLTPINNKENKINTYERLKLSDDAFRIATIDHNPTFKWFFENNSAKLKTIFQLSNYLNPNKSNAKKISYSLNTKAKDYIINSQISLDELWDELYFLSRNQILEIVHEKYN